MKFLPVLLKDGYKVGHRFQYPNDTEEVYSNLTPRNTRRGEPIGLDMARRDGIVFFALQFFVKEFLIEQFNQNFFARSREDVMREYKRRIDNYLGKDVVDCSHIGELHDLGYLPLLLKALPEGSLVPYGVPALTIVNTHPRFFWLTNMLETLMSAVLWKGSTSATTALDFRRRFEKYAALTGSAKDFVPWQGHDFSFRGMSGVEDAAVSGAAHLLAFTGTDTIPAIDFLEQFYNANSDTELVGASVAATEHSVMCMSEPKGELELFRHLLTEVYPGGILSVVSDTWDLWQVLTNYLPALRGVVLARNGKLVIRPDSGDPVKIVCGDPEAPDGSPARDGVVQLLWNTFGGTVTATGHRLLDSHVGVIYGDGISPQRQNEILSRLAENGFASANMVLGMGSYTYQFVTRDTDGWAMKATAGVTRGRGLVEIFKDPITDDGGKRSARGYLRVDNVDGKYVLRQQVSREEERGGCLEPVFCDGRLLRDESLATLRARVAKLF